MAESDSEDREITEEEAKKIASELSEEDLAKLSSGAVKCKSIYSSDSWANL